MPSPSHDGAFARQDGTSARAVGHVLARDLPEPEGRDLDDADVLRAVALGVLGLEPPSTCWPGSTPCAMSMKFTTMMPPMLRRRICWATIATASMFFWVMVSSSRWLDVFERDPMKRPVLTSIDRERLGVIEDQVAARGEDRRGDRGSSAISRSTPPLFEALRRRREIASTLDRRMSDLPSGGYVIFDYTKAFTVVDVNTGRFVGSRSETSSQRLEDTVTKNSLEAVKEVVRQLRLRDIGGVIVIDFVDMANPKNRAQVEDELRTVASSATARRRSRRFKISPLGLVEMTRQNVTNGPHEILTRKCPVYEGDGIVILPDQTITTMQDRALGDAVFAVSGSRVQAFQVAGSSAHTLPLIVGPGGSPWRGSRTLPSAASSSSPPRVTSTPIISRCSRRGSSSISRP